MAGESRRGRGLSTSESPPRYDVSVVGRSAVILLAVLAGTRAGAAPPPWQRTEVRAPCEANALRNPYFGDLHIHTRFSADAYLFGTRADPRDAYAFAQGSEITLADENEAQTRTARIDRPLDFAAVTDHAELFGEVNLCSTPGSAVYDIALCQVLRQVEPPNNRFLATVQWLFPLGIPDPPASHQFCFTPGVDCDAAAVSVWQEMQAAAAAAYAPCAFTTFIGYEHTASLFGRHMHRNVIFRNAVVPPFAPSFLETHAGGTPQGIWSAIEQQCLNAGQGCDALIIPHNSNLSGGMQWKDPADAAEAQRRQTLEPLVEIHQMKGNSECRFDRLAGAGAGTSDELCTFEQNPVAREGIDEPDMPIDLPIDRYPTRNMVRNTLKDGLALEDRLGVNPFRLGFVGGTDTHNATAGNVAEAGWDGGQGNDDATPATQISENMHNNPGGLTVAWAEENSRDALFAALRRRETYATSGTRPVVRFFAGTLAGVTCGSPTFVHDGYAGGTPMGGELGPVRGRKSPRFAVWAMRDPGTDARPGTDLERIQVVKGWVDAAGATHEQVFDVAGAANPAAGVDPATCTPTGSGHAELCAVWEDPSFDRRQRAFYYTRVLENPTCRWSTLVCRGAGVDPLATDCPAQAAAAGPAFANCCLGPATDPFVDALVQERAWTSPVWYQPDGIARVRGTVRFGRRAGTDTLALAVWLGRVPAGLDPAATDLTVRVSDDDEIYAVTLPAGALKHRGPGRFALTGPRGAIGGLAKASLTLDGAHGARLLLHTRPRDLSRADRSEHAVSVALVAGTYRATHSAFWVVQGDRLRSPEP
jgi:hypothetical protein